MSDPRRRNGWTIAERPGDRTPDRTQRLLNRAVWDTFAAKGRGQAVLAGQAGIRDAAGRWLSRTDTVERERCCGPVAMTHRADLLAVLVAGEGCRGAGVSGAPTSPVSAAAPGSCMKGAGSRVQGQ